MPKKKKKWTKKRLTFWFSIISFLVAQAIVTLIPYNKVPEKAKPAYTFVLRYRNKVLNRLDLPFDLYSAQASMEAGNGQVKIFFAPSASIEKELLNFINSAEKSIELCVFELNLQSAADALVAAHARGVQVRLIIDNDYSHEAELNEILAKKIPLQFDPRSAFMHNKFIIVDHQKVWTGSYNFTKNGTRKNDNNALTIESKNLASNYLSEFNEMWAHKSGFFGKSGYGPKSPSSTPYPLIQLEGLALENHFAPEDRVQRKILNEISKAKKSIKVLAFSFTSKEIGRALIQKKSLGLDIQVLFNASGASTEYSQMKNLQEAQIQTDISLNRRGVMHHKVIIIDEQTVITGSFNFSKNADTSNDENIIILRSPEIAAIYTEEFSRCIRGVKGY